MSDNKIKMEWVNSLPKMTFMDEPAIREAFISSNMKTRGTSQGAAETFAEKEAMYLKRVIYASISTSSDLRQCTTFSLYAVYMDMSINGDVLSFNPDDKLVYIEQRGYKIGQDTNGKDVWEQRAKMTISPYGELAIRIDYGQIKYADPVIVVYDGDSWDLETDEKSNIVSRWKSKITGRTSKKIIGAFVKITRANDTWVIGYMLQEDVDRLVRYSLKANRGKFANALYGAGENGEGIDAGFLKAKCLKHSFKNFPKVKLKGSQSQLEDEAQEVPDDYQDQESDPFEGTPRGVQTQQHPNHNGEDFTPASQPGVKAGITVKSPEEEDTF